MKALSTNNIMTIKHKTLDLSEPFRQAFGTPERFGIWFVWGKSGNGKSDLTMQFCKEVAPHYNKIIYNSIEEKFSLSFKRTVERNNMLSIGKKIIFVTESIEDLDKRLEKRGSAEMVVIDSFQAAKLSYDKFDWFCKKWAHKKLLYFVAQAQGTQPIGRSACRAMFDASEKIWVQGYKAFSKGRFIGPNGGTFVIWEEGAAQVWGTENSNA